MWSKVGKVLAAKLDDLSSTPRAHRLSGENRLQGVVL